jgi:hypothetical protein
MDRRLERVHDEIKVLRRLILMGILTKEEYELNSQRPKKIEEIVNKNIERKYVLNIDYNNLVREINRLEGRMREIEWGGRLVDSVDDSWDFRTPREKRQGVDRADADALHARRLERARRKKRDEEKKEAQAKEDKKLGVAPPAPPPDGDDDDDDDDDGSPSPPPPSPPSPPAGPAGQDSPGESKGVSSELDGIKRRHAELIRQRQAIETQLTAESKIGYQESLSLLREFRDAIDIREMFELPAPNIEVREEAAAPGQLVVVQAPEQRQEMLQLQMPAAIRDGPAQVRDAWMAQQQNNVGAVLQHREDMGNIQNMLQQLLAGQQAQATAEAQHALLEGQVEAKGDRERIAEEQAERIERVQESIDQIANDIHNYRNYVNKNVKDCWPLTIYNAIPCMFKLLGMVVSLLIYAHKITYDFMIGITRVVDATVKPWPVIGKPLAFILNGTIMTLFLMTYLSIWTAIFAASGRSDWDAQEMFIFVSNFISNLIIGWIKYSWDIIWENLKKLPKFWIDALWPVISAIWDVFVHISKTLCKMIPSKPLRVLLGCSDGWFSGGNKSKTIDESMESYNKFFAGIKQSIPEEINNEIKEMGDLLMNDTYSIFALQDFACNIIGKVHSEAKKGTSPYFKKIKHELKKEGYGPGKKQVNLKNICNGIMKELPILVESVLGKMEKAVQKLPQIIETIQGEGGTMLESVELSDGISSYNMSLSEKVPYSYDDSGMLKGMVAIVNTWDVNFIKDFNKTTFLPAGLSIEDGEIFKQKLLKGNYTAPPSQSISKRVSPTMSLSNTYKKPEFEYVVSMRPSLMPSMRPSMRPSIMPPMSVAVAAASTKKKKKRKKKTRAERKRSKRRINEQRRKRRTRRKALKKARSRRKR